MSAVIAANAEPIDPEKIRNSKWKLTWIRTGDVVAYNITWTFDNSNKVTDGNWTGTWTINQLHDKTINLNIPSIVDNYIIHVFDNYEMFCVTLGENPVHIGQRTK